MGRTPTAYHLVHDGTGDEGQKGPQGHPRNRIVWQLRMAALLSILSLAFFTASLIGPRLSTMLERTPPITECGRTAAEARSRGCVMEGMIYGFMPPQCHYPEVSAHNKPFTKWQWFADRNMTRPLSEQDLEDGRSIDIWTNKPGYHLEHCLFLYRKLAWAMEKRVKWLDRKTLGVHHAFHCVDQLSSSQEAENATTWSGLGMYVCERTPWS